LDSRQFIMTVAPIPIISLLKQKLWSWHCYSVVPSFQAPETSSLGHKPRTVGEGGAFVSVISVP
jgi:hypothetical protein